MEEKTIVCPHCGTGNTPTSRYCSHCGKPLLAPDESPLPAEAAWAPEGRPGAGKDIIENDAPTIRDESLSEKHRSRLRIMARGEPDLVVRSEINQREQNEDSFQVYDLLTPAAPGGLKVLAVADGMGGHAYGEHVSREVLRTISRALFEQCVVLPTLNELATPFQLSAQKMSDILWHALEEANARVQQMVRSNKWGKAGSTVVVGVILQQTLIVANLGDSPLFVYRQASKHIRKITEDHTVAGVLVRKKLIPPEMARFHEGRSRLEFYVGADTLPKRPPLYQCTLGSGDLVLLCSDGISGSLTLKQMETAISEASDDLKTVADRLIETALATDETDNQTLILWRSHSAL